MGYMRLSVGDKTKCCRGALPHAWPCGQLPRRGRLSQIRLRHLTPTRSHQTGIAHPSTSSSYSCRKSVKLRSHFRAGLVRETDAATWSTDPGSVAMAPLRGKVASSPPSGKAAAPLATKARWDVSLQPGTLGAEDPGISRR